MSHDDSASRSASSSRRERRVIARREEIVRAAARVFAERGYHCATTRDIPEAADVSEATLYNYFAGKELLLLGIVDRLVETRELAGLLVQAQTGNPCMMLRTLLAEQ